MLEQTRSDCQYQLNLLDSLRYMLGMLLNTKKHPELGPMEWPCSFFVCRRESFKSYEILNV